MKQLLVIICLIVLLIARFFHYFTNLQQPFEGKKVKIEHTFLSETKKTTTGQGFFVDGVYVLLPRFPEYQYSQSIVVEGTISQAKSKKSSTSAGTEQSEVRVLRNEGTDDQFWILKNPKVTRGKDSFLKPLLSVSSFIRQSTAGSYNRTLDAQKAALLMGMVFGIKEGMSDKFEDQLTNSGVLHVVAASGSNVALVASFTLSLLLLFLRRQVAIGCLFVILILYALISGLDPSIVRATLMGGIAFSAQLFGRQTFSYLALSFTAIVMLLIDPALITNVGFQLSFMATLGILILKPILDIKLKKIHFPTFKDDVTTTFSAQILTIPIISYHFQTFAPISFLSNLLILWTIPILMLLGGVAALLSLIHPLLSAPFLYLSFPLLSYFEYIVGLTALNPVDVTRLPLVLIAGYYCIVGAVLLKTR